MLGLYDSRGIRYSARHLERVKHEIMFYPLALQSEYADALTTKNAKNDEFVMYSSGELLRDENIEALISKDLVDATTIGNIAFLALNANNKAFRERCITILDKYRAIIKTKVQNNQINLKIK